MSTNLESGTSRIEDPISESSILEYRVDLKKFALRIVPNRLWARIDPSDLVQDTLFITIGKISLLTNLPKRIVYSWMIKVLKNCAKQKLRKAAIEDKYKSKLAKSVNVQSAGQYEEIMLDELRSVMNSKMNSLDEQTRNVLKMRYFEGLDLDEIVLKTNKTKSSIRNIIYRGLVQIKGDLNEYFEVGK